MNSCSVQVFNLKIHSNSENHMSNILQIKEKYKTLLEQSLIDKKLVLPDGLNEEDTFDLKYAFYSDIENMKNFSSVWSIFEIADFKIIPFENIRELHYTNDIGYMGFVSFDKAPTWLELWSACDSLIAFSGDKNHIYIEAIKHNNITKSEIFFNLHTGS